MKILILIFILYVHYCTCQFYPEDAKKPTNPFPKKVRPGIIQYNNAGNYFKSAPQKTRLKTKSPSNQQVYTAFARPFARSGEFRAHHQIVPDSPYFPVDEPTQPERRSRVKKVLPEYQFPSRYKRSADDKGDDKGDDKKTKLKASDLPSSKGQTGVKKSLNPIPKTEAAKGATKDLKAPVKKITQVEILRSKKRGQNSRVSKKKGLARDHATGSKNKKLRNPRNKKLRNPNERISQKHSRPDVGRSKKTKSSQKLRGSKKLKESKKLKGSKKRKNSKKRSKSDRADRKLKSRPQRGAQRLNSKNVLRKGLQNNTTKARSVKNSKGPNARRLIAARDATIEEYPYTISLQKDGVHWCSGAILNPRLIITTANCLWRSNSISRMRVRVGSRHTDRGGQVARIQEVMKHPGWKLRKNPDNDVALALLDRNIRFSHGLHGVDLPNRAMLPPFDDAWVTSWGAERRDGIFDSRSVNLQVYHARLMDRDKCNNITHRFAVTVTENFICLSQSGTRAPCTRDTGAPAVSDGVLWGLASWSIRKLCGTERFPAMFSYIASPTNMDFIVNATHYLMTEEKSYPYLDRYPIVKPSITTPTPITLPYKR